MSHDTIIAFDIGLKRTGVASGQSLTKNVQVVGQLQCKNGQFIWSEVDKLIQQWQPTKIVVGNPNTDNPHLNKLINRFKHYVREQHKLSIIDVDETLSSNEANQHLNNQSLSVNKKIELRDQIAACLILQSYFNSLPTDDSD